ncbi:MAG: hypothetical protein Q4E87_04105 [bacterium]|nr:hypothetical protein [bacterium]
MNDTVFWGMGLAVCWTVGWLLTFVEEGIRRRLGVHGREVPFAEMMKRMHIASPGWCTVYVVICLVHIGLLVVAVIGLAWALVSGGF